MKDPIVKAPWAASLWIPHAGQLVGRCGANRWLRMGCFHELGLLLVGDINPASPNINMYTTIMSMVVVYFDM